MSPATLFLGLFFLFFSAALIKAIALKKQRDLYQCKLLETTGFLEKAREDLKYFHDLQNNAECFKNSLAAAELTTQFQKPRLSVQTSPANNSIPERYNFIHSLIQKKMSSDEIASILSISPHEAEQIVTLSKLGKTY